VFNEKGQASSVFNILIAGVIALAILGILMSLLSGVSPIQGNPLEIAQTQLQKATENPFVIHKSPQSVVFNNNDMLTARAVAQKTTSVIADQVIFSAGERSDAFFKINNAPNGGSTLVFESSSSQQSKIAVYCDENQKIVEKIELFAEISDIPSDGCGDSVNDAELCCVIYPVRP
jgi:hypothetical protein